MTGMQGMPPMATLSLISSSLAPKLEPSIATRVPPSIGPDSGWIWSSMKVKFILIKQSLSLLKIL